jgi:anaerobic dimethyl sulfoxide reductase subunit B (iron-sulfur subunit)
MTTGAKEALIHFDPDRCTQCHGCETACATWRELAHGIRYRRVLNRWQGAYPRVTCLSLSLACLHCVEPACAAACPEEAIVKRTSDGLVAVVPDLCTGCGLCAEACAFGVPQFSADGIMQKCDLCRGRPSVGNRPPCVDTCPGRALSLVEISPLGKKDHEARTARLLGQTPSIY